MPLNDHDDVDNKSIFKNGAHLPSPAMDRLNVAILKGLEIWRADREKHPDLHALGVPGTMAAIRAMRPHIRALHLPPSRLYRMASIAWSTATYTGSPLSGEMPADRLVKDKDYTHGEWRASAWLVTLAAWAELVTSAYRPETMVDLIDLLKMCRLNGSIVTTREGKRFQNRMRRYLDNVVDGAPFDFGIAPRETAKKAAKPRRAVRAAKAPKGKVPKRMLPAFQAASQRRAHAHG